VRHLAGNLEGFPPEKVRVTADAVYGWCDGHPYLTQRLFELTEASEECRRASLDQLPAAVDRLVATHLLYGDDANVTHILHYLQESETYRDQVFKILKQERRRSVMHADDLLSIGIIKRSRDQYLVIRNKIYVETLNTFFAEAERS